MDAQSGKIEKKSDSDSECSFLANGFFGKGGLGVSVILLIVVIVMAVYIYKHKFSKKI